MDPSWLRVAWVIGLCGCRGNAPLAAEPASCDRPTGQPWMAALRPGTSDLNGFRLTVTSIGEHAYALQVQGTGVRRTIGDGAPACGPRPEPRDPCAAIPFLDFHDELWLRVLDERLTATSIYADGLHVHDFAELDAAALALADALRAGRIADPWFVRVVAPGCVELVGRNP